MSEFLTPLEVNYFSTRLSEARRASQLTAAMQFDLARTPITNDQLQRVAESFGAPQTKGWGFSDMLQKVLSATPKQIPVSDIRKLQQNLVNQGYAEPGALVNGIWDPSWYGAFSRFDRDTQDAIRAGHDWNSAPFESGVRMIANTLPSRVWQGMVGAAKGFVLQTPETVGRVGALGGAAAGAAIGASLGTLGGPLAPLTSTAGAIGGAVVGGIVGFFGDILGHDPTTEGSDQSMGAKILDALQPFNEYAKLGPRAFMEDLGYVGTAASLISGVGMAERGVGDVMAGIRAAQAAPVEAAAIAGSGAAMPEAPWELANVAGAPANVEPLSFGRALLMRPPGAPAQLGVVEKVIAGVTRARSWAPDGVKAFEEWVARPANIAKIPAVQLATKVYTGVSAGQLGARMIAGLGSGQSSTTIAKTIASTPELRTGINLPLIGDMTNLAAFFIAPERFFPWQVGDIGRAATRLMGNTDILPWAHVFNDGRALSLRESVDLAKATVTPELNMQVRADYGVKALAREDVRALPVGRQDWLAQLERQHEIIRQIHLEGEAGAQYGPGRRWLSEPPELAGTKVVAPDGAPLRVYHGTTNEFSGFNLDRAQDGLYGPGIYFAEDPRVANTYANEGASNVHFSYLDIKNPFDTTGTITNEEARRISGEGTYRAYEPTIDARAFYRDLAQAKGSKEAANIALQRAGYDGIFHIGQQDGRVWVAFEESQVHLGVPMVRVGKGELFALGESPTLKKAIQQSLDHPGDFEKWLFKLKGQDSGPDWLAKWADAQRVALQHESEIDKGSLVEFGNVVMSRDMVPVGEVPKALRMAVAEGSPLDRRVVQSEIARLEKQATKLERDAAKAGLDASGNLILQARDLRAQVEQLKLWRPKSRTTLRTPETVRITPARIDTITQKGFLDYQARFDVARENVITAWKADPLGAAYVDAQMHLTQLLDEMANKGIITDKMAASAAVAAPSKDVSKFLGVQAKHAARDLMLPADKMAQYEALGYKPVITGEDVLFPRDVRQMAEVTGVGDYTRRASFFETIGLSPTKRSDIDVYKLRQKGEVSEVRQFLDSRAEQFGKKIDPERFIKDINQQLDTINHQGVVKGPLVFRGEGKTSLPKFDLREISPDDLMGAAERAGIQGFTEADGLALYGALKRGAAIGGEATFRNPWLSARALAENMQIKGLPGFSDWVRTAHVDPTKKLLAIPAGAALGAAEGAYEGRGGGRSTLDDIVRGAIMGASAGAGLAWLLKKSYGYLPDLLVRVNTALRYTFSIGFDAKRYAKNNVIAMEKYGLPAIFQPEKYIKTFGEMKSPFGGVVSGDEAWNHFVRFFDQLNGTDYFRGIDDVSREAFQKGLLGFAPRDYEVAHAALLYQRNMGTEDIMAAVKSISRYGLGRSAAEKSANFIFFPFSFEKKFLMATGDFILQAPARNLILQEGWRRYSQSTFRGDVHDFLDKHLPILKEIRDVNALEYGLSPGRFFLEGLDDNRTNVGKVAQILASVFVPSGAATPLAQAAGGMGDLTVQAFTPVVVTGESISRIGGINNLFDVVNRYIPFTRELNQYWTSLKDQKIALFEGAAPEYQFQDYVNKLREFKDELQPLALALGYSGADGLLSSDIGLPFKLNYDKLRLNLEKKYPTGAAMVSAFENSALARERGLQDLVDKAHKTAGEEAIVNLSEEEQKWGLIGQVLNMSPDVVGQLTAYSVRRYAMRFVNDRRFQELYRLFFERQYGPIAMTAVPPAA